MVLYNNNCFINIAGSFNGTMINILHTVINAQEKYEIIQTKVYSQVKPSYMNLKKSFALDYINCNVKL